MRLGGDWNTFDPQIAPNGQAAQLIYALYDKLVDIGPHGTIVPYLAKSWVVTPTSVTFTLRKDATCSDGTPVTPGVVAGSLTRLTKSTQAARLFGTGPYTVASSDSAGTVTLSLGTPFSAMIWGFTNYATAIVCPSGLANPTTLVTTPSGSGPYVLDSAVHGDSVTLKVHKGWKWGPLGTTAAAPGFPDTLVFRIVTNETTAANLLITGGLDVASIIGPDVDRLRADSSLTPLEGNSYGGYPLVFNELPGHATADVKVRQALVTAIDPKAWNVAAYNGRGTVSPSYLYPGAECYADTSNLLPSPSTSAARQVLLADGYTVGANNKLVKNGQTIKINLLGTGAFGSGTEYVFSQWQTVGIDATLSNLEFNSYFQAIVAGKFDAAIQASAPPIPTMAVQIGYSTGPIPPKGLNFARIVDPAVDSEIALADQTVGAQSCVHWKAVQRLLLQNYDLLPLSAPITNWFSKGIEFQPASGFMVSWSLRRIK